MALLCGSFCLRTWRLWDDNKAALGVVVDFQEDGDLVDLALQNLSIVVRLQQACRGRVVFSRQCIALVFDEGVERVASSSGVGGVECPWHAAVVVAWDVFGLRAVVTAIVGSMVMAVGSI